MKQLLIKHARIVNEGSIVRGAVLVEGERIARVLTGQEAETAECPQTIDAADGYLLPGVIDEHVHFRDPGLTHKADIATESRAAAAGGVTSVMDMPNTLPQTVTLEAWEEKRQLMAEKSVVNHACYFGATNDNYPLFARLDPHRVCGIKLFMGSSTGNMLVDRTESLRRIFGETDLLIAAHCEDQHIIQANTERFRRQTGGEVPLACHPAIRSEEACFRSTELAVRLADEAGARLHVLHLSTARELGLFQAGSPAGKRITAEACVAHLLFDENDYATLGARIKCNPAVKTAADRQALRDALTDGRIDAVATDHAPHLWNEKQGGALTAASGMPMIQFSLVSMLELADRHVLSIEQVAEKMCHAPARLYGIRGRGFIRPGYMADLVIVHPGNGWTVDADCIRSKCRWSPLEGHTFRWQVEQTFVNGQRVFDCGCIDDRCRGQELYFE